MKLLGFGMPAAAFAALVALYLGGIDVARLPAVRGSNTYTDRNGTLLGTVLGLGSIATVRVPLREVSPSFLTAIVAAEDARFWRHGAIDLPALLRAARDYALFGEPRSGGSTIEMQLARMMRPAPSTIGAKIAQIALAERIAIRSSKPAILQAYVNRVPMGGNVYGVEAAARTYFGEPAAELDLAQATLLAAIPNDPSRLAPGNDWPALRSRQRFILERMVRLREIDEASARLAFAETLRVRRHDAGIAQAAHAVFYMASEARGSGARVRTTLDPALQRFVQAQTQDVIAALSADHVTDAAALIADNRTGDVIAYVGSPDYFSDAALGRNDGVQALRQPGSSLKPFTYELALERKTIDSTTILSDTAAAYALPGGRLYQPADYSGRFSGPVRVRYALANSLNAPAVAVLSRLGVATLLDRLHALGFAHLDRPPSYYGLGLTLGSGEVSLWELVQAYSTLARDGEFLPLRLLETSRPAPRRIGHAADWELVADMLADPHARAEAFGVGSVLQMPFPAAVKTGTSSDFRDTWTVGFTRDYTVGAWVGNFDGSAMHGVSGVTGAGPLWNRIMLHLYERRDEPPPFAAPRGFVRATICATTGKTPGPDCSGIVEEWVLPGQLSAIRRPNAPPPFHIVSPGDGDVFVANAPSGALARAEEQIALHAANAKGSIAWRVGDRTVVTDATGTAFWPLQLGTWRIQADDGPRRDAITIRVVPPPKQSHPGFTFSKRP